MTAETPKTDTVYEAHVREIMAEYGLSDAEARARFDEAIAEAEAEHEASVRASYEAEVRTIMARFGLNDDAARAKYEEGRAFMASIGFTGPTGPLTLSAKIGIGKNYCEASNKRAHA